MTVVMVGGPAHSSGVSGQTVGLVIRPIARRRLVGWGVGGVVFGAGGG